MPKCVFSLLNWYHALIQPHTSLTLGQVFFEVHRVNCLWWNATTIALYEIFQGSMFSLSGDFPFQKLAERILEECHQTFVSCFHAFYPTGSLKWMCLCDLLSYIEPVSTGTTRIIYFTNYEITIVMTILKGLLLKKTINNRDILKRHWKTLIHTNLSEPSMCKKSSQNKITINKKDYFWHFDLKK